MCIFTTLLTRVTLCTKMKTKIFFIILAVFLVFALAEPTLAQNTGDLVPCSGPACQWCDVFKLLQNVLNTFTALLGFIVIIFIMYGGYLYLIGGTVGGTTSKKKDDGSVSYSNASAARGKETMTDAIVGLVLIMLAWLLTNAVIVGLTGAKLTDFLSVDCSEFESLLPDATPGGGGGGGGGGTIPPEGGGGDEGGGGSDDKPGELTHDEAKEQLENHDPPIPINNECTGTPTKTCTSLEGVRQETIDGIMAFQEACGCYVIITGGTEPGHADGEESHGTGYKVDIDDNAAVDTYIRKNYTQVVPPTFGKEQYTGPNGEVFTFEDPPSHWDIKFP